MTKFIMIIAFCTLTTAINSSAQQPQLSCLLVPGVETNLSSSVQGVVSKVHVKRGGQVKKGQVLISLASDLDRAVLRSAVAKADFSKRKLARNQKLLDQDLLSEFEHDELLTESRLALLQVEEVKVRVAQRSVLSPIDGVVVKRHVSAGEYVGTDPVMDLVSLDPLYAEVLVEATQYGAIVEGMAVNVRMFLPGVASDAQRTISGKVDVVDRVIDAASGTFGFRVMIPNTDLSLPAGLKCRVDY